MSYNPGNETLYIFIIHVMALHCMGFPRTGLSIGHDSAVETWEDILQHRLPQGPVDFLLGGGCLEHMIKHERDLLSIWVFDNELPLIMNTVYLLSIVG